MLIKLKPEHARLLRRPLRGNGGFQSFLRRLQRHLNANDELEISLPELNRAKRLRQRYGAGGFQGRLAWVEL